ncbi:hypothetical protein LCGC14_1668720 [marine sediment metagenome]|uniref:Uncharacterized protein n=1 Tax=marine sediment metagenome TaxID=412755 RepID=A0A0F9HSU1_9ZZZZ
MANIMDNAELNKALSRAFTANWRLARRVLGWTQRLTDAQAEKLLHVVPFVSESTGVSWFITGSCNGTC